MGARMKVANVFLSTVLVLGLTPAAALADVSASAGVDAQTGAGTQAGVSPYAVDIPGDNLADPFLDDDSTAGWSQYGSCEWKLDTEGVFTLRPLNNGISGTLPAWTQANNLPWWNQRESIKAIVVKPGVIAQTCAGMFAQCSALTSVDLLGLDTSRVETMSYMFAMCTSLTSVNMGGLNMPKVTNIVSMFEGCAALTSVDLSDIGALAMKDLGSMFRGCTALTSVDLSGINAAHVDSTNWMFYGCPAITHLTLPAELDLSGSYLREAAWTDSQGHGFDTKAMMDDNAARTKGTQTYVAAKLSAGWTQSGSCEWRVDNAGKLTVRPLGGSASGTLANWDYNGEPWRGQVGSITSVVIEPGVAAQSCITMFSGCWYMTSADLSGLDTSQVTSMEGMFSGCWALKSLNLSTFDTVNVTDMRQMFYNCEELKTIVASERFVTSNVVLSDEMFAGCTSLVGPQGTKYDPSATNAACARTDGGAAAPGYFAAPHQPLDGDVNGNGVLNAVDAQIAYDLATIDLYQNRADYADMRARADVTWDGEVDAADAFAIQYAALHGWRD